MRKNNKELLDRLNMAKLVIGYTKALIVAIPLLAALIVSLVSMDIAYTNVNAATDNNITALARVNSVDEVKSDLTTAAVGNTVIIDLTRIAAVDDIESAYARIEAVSNAISELTRTESTENEMVGLSRLVERDNTIALDRIS